MHSLYRKDPTNFQSLKIFTCPLGWLKQGGLEIVCFKLWQHHERTFLRPIGKCFWHDFRKQESKRALIDYLAEPLFIEQYYCLKHRTRIDMPSGCCTNCRTKYAIFTPENGCSNCAFSFCSKCIGYKALLPRLADKPVSVCYSCYQKLNDLKILKSNEVSGSKQMQTSVHFWGDNLPPPSFRQTAELKKKHAFETKCRKQADPHERGLHLNTSTVEDLEKRLNDLKHETTKEIPSVEEIEKRLAALRECDIELIRNPKMWFNSKPSEIHAENAEELLENVKSRTEIDKKYNEDEMLEARFRRLQDDKEGLHDDENARASMVIEKSELSTGEQEQIKKLMNEANVAVQEAEKRLKNDAAIKKELKDVMASARQKSLDMEIVNSRVNNEISNFWDKQIEKQDSDDEIDDETVLKIVAEVESLPNEEENPTAALDHELKKKKGFFNRLFKK